MTALELWNQLATAGLVAGEPPPAAEPPAPWPVRAMLGIAGWVGSLFLLGFAAAVFGVFFDNVGVAIPAGMLCCGCAFLLFFTMPRNDFAQQAGLAVSLAGQALLAVGVSRLVGEHPPAPVFLILAVVEAALCALLPNYLHRIFTAVAANVLFFLAAASYGVPALGISVTALAACLLWLNDEIRMADAALWEPIGFGCAIALLPMDGTALLGLAFWQFLERHSAALVLVWLASIATGVAILAVAWILLNRLRVAPDSPGGILTLTGATIVAVCGVWAHGVSASLLVLTLGFAAGRRSLQGVGLFAFLAYLAHFYYDLQITLLHKSFVLSGTGVALLLLWAIVRRTEKTA